LRNCRPSAPWRVRGERRTPQRIPPGPRHQCKRPHKSDCVLYDQNFGQFSGLHLVHLPCLHHLKYPTAYASTKYLPPHVISSQCSTDLQTMERRTFRTRRQSSKNLPPMDLSKERHVPQMGTQSSAQPPLRFFLHPASPLHPIHTTIPITNR
jgi:hypothetical protein